MAFTDAEVATKVLKRLGAPIAQRPNIFLFIPPARALLAREIANSQDESRKTLQKIFTGLTLASQAVDLSALVNLDPKSAEPLLITAPFPAVRIGTTNVWFKSDWQLLQLGTIRNDQIWYAMEGSVMHFRSKGTVTGTASITAQYVPLTANWPEGRYEKQLLDTVVSMIQSQAAA